MVDYVGQVYQAGGAEKRRTGRPGSTFWRCFAAALALRFVFAGFLDTTPLAPFVPALPIAALICGWRKAVVLMAVSAVATLTIARVPDERPAPALFG